MSAATPFGLSSLPLLSIITWSPFVGALLIMFLARRHALLVRGLAEDAGTLTARWSQAGGDACTLHYDLGKPGNEAAAMLVRDALCTR